MRKNFLFLLTALSLSAICIGCNTKNNTLKTGETPEIILESKSANSSTEKNKEQVSNSNESNSTETIEHQLSSENNKQYISEIEAINNSKTLISKEEQKIIKNYDKPSIELVSITESSADLLKRPNISGKMAYVITYELDHITEYDIIYVDATTGEVYGSMPMD